VISKIFLYDPIKTFIYKKKKKMQLRDCWGCHQYSGKGTLHEKRVKDVYFLDKKINLILIE